MLLELMLSSFLQNVVVDAGDFGPGRSQEKEQNLHHLVFQ